MSKSRCPDATILHNYGAYLKSRVRLTDKEGSLTMQLGPSNFLGDDYGEAANQLGHVMVGAAVVSAGYALGLAYVAVSIGVLLGVLWEARHLMIGGRGKDSRNDLFFYALGLAYSGPLWWPILGLGLVGLHVWRRMR